MSANPHWRKVCTECGEVLGAFSVTDGDDGKAVKFLSSRNMDKLRLERLTEGDDGYPVSIGHLCIHHGGSYVPPDPNQGDLFGAQS